MRMLSIALFCLTLAIPSIGQSTDALTDSSQKSLTSTSSETLQNNQSPALSTLNHHTPQIIYQQALNYLLGRNGVTKSTEKAASLFKTLAEQNWSSAQHMLGNMYYAGKGVEKNELLAYKWLSLASKNNLQLARAIQAKRLHLRNKLQTSLSDQSMDKVEVWITQWQPETGQPIPEQTAQSEPEQQPEQQPEQLMQQEQAETIQLEQLSAGPAISAQTQTTQATTAQQLSAKWRSTGNLSQTN